MDAAPFSFQPSTPILLESFRGWQRNHIVATGSYSSMSIPEAASLWPALCRRPPIHRSLLLSAMVGSFLLGFTPLSAQDAPDTLKVQSQLVVLDVVVTDKSGNLVANLNRDDFQVSENGVRQEIRNFDSPHRVDTIPVTAPKDKFGRENWDGAPLTMIVVDEMDTPFEETAYSR